MNRFLYLHRHHSVKVAHEEATLEQQSDIAFRGAKNLVLQLLPPSSTFPDRLALCDWFIQETANCRNYRAKPNAES